VTINGWLRGGEGSWVQGRLQGQRGVKWGREKKKKKNERSPMSQTALCQSQEDRLAGRVGRKKKGPVGKGKKKEVIKPYGSN